MQTSYVWLEYNVNIGGKDQCESFGVEVEMFPQLVVSRFLDVQHHLLGMLPVLEKKGVYPIEECT